MEPPRPTLKASAAEQRELWIKVGEALLVGRRENKSDKLFGQWVKAFGFDDIKPRTRSAAMWLAETYSAIVADYPPEITHPVALQEWFNEQKTTSSLPADLADIQPETVETIKLDQRSAERLSKLALRAQEKDAEGEMAKRHLDGIAKKHGVASTEFTDTNNYKSKSVLSPSTALIRVWLVVTGVDMKRILNAALAAIMLASLTACVVVPPNDYPYYGEHHRHYYHQDGYGPRHDGWGRRW